VLSEFEDYQLLIYGGVLIAIMLLRPQGLIPNVRRMRELARTSVSRTSGRRPSRNTTRRLTPEEAPA